MMRFRGRKDIPRTFHNVLHLAKAIRNELHTVADVDSITNAQLSDRITRDLGGGKVKLGSFDGGKGFNFYKWVILSAKNKKGPSYWLLFCAICVFPLVVLGLIASSSDWLKTRLATSVIVSICFSIFLIAIEWARRRKLS